MAIKITGVTANCGNSTIGKKASEKIIQLLSADLSGVVVINCQEVHYDKQLKQLKDAIKNHPNLQLVPSGLMVTRTKFDRDVIGGATGIATFVLYDTNKIDNLAFIPSKAQEIRGNNRNKGGYLNSLTIREKNSSIVHEVRTISGHLDSNSETKRAKDWQNIKKGNAFEASNWSELAARVPSLQIAGYDANTRSIWNKITSSVTNLWRESPLDPRVAPIALSPIGMSYYSANNTYKVQGGTLTEDKKRPGYAKGGSLDFVSVQNNTQISKLESIDRRYKDAFQNLEMEQGTKRDHNVIISPPSTIESSTEFMRVQQYVFAELVSAAPQLAKQIKGMTDTEENRKTLLELQQYYLNPKGALIRNIVLDTKNSGQIVNPYFRSHTLENFKNGKLKQIEALIHSANKVIKLFNPMRLLYTKTKYLALNEAFNNAYKAYLDELEKKVPVNIKDKQKELYKALNNLMEVTKDSKKKESVLACQKALSQLDPSFSDERRINHTSTALSFLINSPELTTPDKSREITARFKANISQPISESMEEQENSFLHKPSNRN